MNSTKQRTAVNKMQNCDLKYLVIIISFVLIVVGIYLAFIKARADIQAGIHSPEQGEYDNGKFSFKFTIGLVLIVMGLVSIFSAGKYFPCDGAATSTQTTPTPLEVKPPNTKVEGWVKDEQGNDVAGAAISIQGRSETGETDSGGHFLITLPNYNLEEASVKITAQGFKNDPPSIKEVNSVSDYILHK